MNALFIIALTFWLNTVKVRSTQLWDDNPHAPDRFSLPGDGPDTFPSVRCRDLSYYWSMFLPATWQRLVTPRCQNVT